MWPFRRHQDLQEMTTEDPRDAELRGIGWDELDKEADLDSDGNVDTAMLGPLSLTVAMRALREQRRLRKGDRDSGAGDTGLPD
jgi:hypothetical protein